MLPTNDSPAVPMVYVKETLVWEYTQIVKELPEVASVEELNTLGRDGWELVGMVSAGPHLVYTFKRTDQ